MNTHVESIVRTNKLYCSNCYKPIKKGEEVVFELENGRMENVYCPKCKHNYEREVIEDSEHIYSSEAHGQW